MYGPTDNRPPVNALFWITVIVDAIIVLILIVLGTWTPAGGSGGREMAMLFGVVLPALVVTAGVVLYRRAESPKVRLIAFAIVSAPAVLLAATRLRSAVVDMQVRRNAAGSGYFSGGDLAVAGAAVVQGNASSLRQIGPGLAVNSAGTGGVTLINLAVEQGRMATTSPDERTRRLGVVQTLLDLGADPDPALAEATKVPDAGFLALLLDAGADPNFTQQGEPIVFEWLAVTPVSHFTLLCDRGLNLNVVNRIGEPLIIAAGRADRWDIVELLLARGANYRARDRQGDGLLGVVDGRLTSSGTQPDERKEAIRRVKTLITR